MYPNSLQVEQILTMLEEAPPRLASLTADLTPVQLITAHSLGEWSARDVLAHMRSCSDMWGSAIRTILAEDRPTIKAVNPTTWIKQTDYLEQEFRPSLQAFTTQRAELMSLLKALSPQDWSRGATVKASGKPLARTVHFYAQWLARHERPHIKQIARIAEVVQG